MTREQMIELLIALDQRLSGRFIITRLIVDAQGRVVDRLIRSLPHERTQTHDRPSS
jgi:hypothetical protein